MISAISPRAIPPLKSGIDTSSISLLRLSPFLLLVGVSLLWANLSCCQFASSHTATRWISTTMDDPTSYTLIHPAYILLGIVVIVTFYFIMFLLPDDAYGEEDVRVFSSEKLRSRYRTHVVVLGDIGRSPRMQNHAIALARRSAAVNLIGYTGIFVTKSHEFN